MKPSLDDVVFALVREHLKNRGYKEAAATFKDECGGGSGSGSGSGGISGLKALCAELNVTEQHRGRRRAGVKGSVMMSLCELLFSPKEEKNNKGATLEKEYEAAQRVGAGRRAKRGAEGREANARAASASAHATLAGFGFDVVEETEKPNLHGFDVLEEAAEVVRAPSSTGGWGIVSEAEAPRETAAAVVSTQPSLSAVMMEDDGIVEEDLDL
jgi:hypothetical protein